MNARRPRPFVSVKRSPVDRPASFLLPDSTPDTPAPAPGDPVVVQTAEGRAMGTVTATPSVVAPRREPAESSPLQVVRRASRDDVLTRLRQQQREQDAYRVCLMKIRERGMAMKLTRVEQAFDGERVLRAFAAVDRALGALERNASPKIVADWSAVAI